MREGSELLAVQDSTTQKQKQVARLSQRDRATP